MKPTKSQNDCVWRHHSRKLAIAGGALAFLLGLLLPTANLEADDERLASTATTLSVR